MKNTRVRLQDEGKLKTTSPVEGKMEGKARKTEDRASGMGNSGKNPVKTKKKE